MHGDSIKSFAVAASVVFIDGWFGHVGGAARPEGFAAVDAATGKATSFRRAAFDPVVANGKLYVDLDPHSAHTRSAAFDLPNLVRDRRWAPPSFGYVFAADSQFAYSRFQTNARPQFRYTGDLGVPDKEQLVALDPATGAVRWRSPVFSQPINPYGGSSIPRISLNAVDSSTYVPVGGNFQRVQD